MLLTELFDILDEEVSHNLNGTISNDEIAIKWEYDCFNTDFEIDESEEEHLEKIYNDDIEIIKEYINIDDFNITNPTIEDTYISFYIEE